MRYWRANAALISQAKEMAKLLQDLIPVLSPLVDNPVHEQLMSKVKETLKKAIL